jgi:hypothetical protein
MSDPLSSLTALHESLDSVSESILEEQQPLRRPRRKSVQQRSRRYEIIRTPEELDRPKDLITSSRKRSNGVHRKSEKQSSISNPLPVRAYTNSKPRTPLEQVLRVPMLRDGLLEFARKEFSDESILLLIAILDYKNSVGVDNRTKQAHDIYYRFIMKSAAQEVNLDAGFRETLYNRLQGLDPACYIRYSGKHLKFRF